MTKIKIFTVLILWCIPFVLFSQEKHSGESLLLAEAKKKANQFKGQINFNKALLFTIEKTWDSTLVYTMKELSENTINKELVDYCHYFRGYSFKEKKLFNEAKIEFRAISAKFKFHHKVKMILGEISLEQGDFTKALDYFKHIERLPKNGKYDFKKSVFMHNMGMCYTNLNQLDKAEYYLFKSLKLQEIDNDTILLIGTNMDIAILYYSQNKQKQAFAYFEKAYQLSKKINDFGLKKTVALNMAELEEIRKNYPLALTYRRELEQWTDSLNDQNKVWAVADLEKKFAVKQKQKEVTVLQTENKLKIAE